MHVKDGFCHFRYFVCSSAHLSAKFVFNELIDYIKKGCDVMIENCDWKPSLTNEHSSFWWKMQMYVFIYNSLPTVAVSYQLVLAGLALHGSSSLCQDGSQSSWGGDPMGHHPTAWLYCTDSGFKLRHTHNMAAPRKEIFWLHFCIKWSSVVQLYIQSMVLTHQDDLKELLTSHCLMSSKIYTWRHSKDYI